MKILAAFLFLSLIPSVVRADSESETSLCNAKGLPVAYVADDMTIYLWGGKPVAYLSSDAGPDSINIYGFNGKHLGWFAKGMIYDHDGAIVGAVPTALKTPEQSEPYKSYKQYCPYKAYKEYAPSKPAFSKTWSDTPLIIFLSSGNPDP